MYSLEDNVRDISRTIDCYFFLAKSPIATLTDATYTLRAFLRARRYSPYAGYVYTNLETIDAITKRPDK